MTLRMLESLRATEPAAGVLVIDDGSPAPSLVDEIEDAKSRLHFDLDRKAENEGFSRTVNVGLRRALDEGRDAVLANADMVFTDDGWLQALTQQQRRDGRPAEVVGALLLYPTDLIQHAGIFFSLLHRCFEHIYKYAPYNLPEAQKARACPVTGALQFIRHATLVEVGVYDEEFRLGWEDVDYCIRTFLAGGECVYTPDARAYHLESLFRGRPSPKVADWQSRSWLYFVEKYKRQSFAQFVPSVA